MSQASLQQSPSSGRLELAGSLDFNTVSSVRGALLPHLRKNRQLVIDLEGVDRSNSAALALLLQWIEDALDRGCRLQFVNMPDTLVDIAELHGLKGLLPITSS